MSQTSYRAALPRTDLGPDRWRSGTVRPCLGWRLRVDDDGCVDRCDVAVAVDVGVLDRFGELLLVELDRHGDSVGEAEQQALHELGLVRRVGGEECGEHRFVEAFGVTEENIEAGKYINHCGDVGCGCEAVVEKILLNYH